LIMSLTKQDILSMNDTALRKLCSKKKIKGITKRSSRTECIDALLKHAKAPPSATKTDNLKSPIVNRRRKAPHSSRRLISHSSSPVRPVLSSSRKKRKRPFAEMQSSGRSGSDGQTSDSDSQRRKRRRTSNISNQSTPIKNPREPAMAQVVPGRQFISNEFDALLNASDSDDDDVPIPDKDMIPSPPIPPSKRPGNVHIQTIKPSSDDSDDEETESEDQSSENNEFSESDDTPRARRLRDRQRKEKERRRKRKRSRGRKRRRHRSEDDATSDDSESETESAFSEETTSDEEEEGVLIKRKSNKSTKSRSKSKSRVRGKGNRSHSTTGKQSKSTSNLQGRSQSTTRQRPKSRSNHNLSPPINSIGSRPGSRIPLPSSPYSVPKVFKSSNSSSTTKKPNKPPISRSMSPQTTLQQCVRTIYDVVDAVLIIPRNVFCGIRFLFKHWMAVLIVGVLSILLYSPTVKLVSNFDFRGAVEWLITPRVRYCNSIGSIDANDDCVECPVDADCHDGIAYCKGDRVLIRGECLYDENEVNSLKSQMESYTLSLLSTIRAEKECRSYWLYSIFDDSVDAEFDGMYLPEEALEKQLALSLQLDIRSHLFTQVFALFTSEIKSRRDEPDDVMMISAYSKRKDLDFKVDRGYFSHRAAKSIRCHLSILMTDYATVIVPCTLVASLLLISWSVRRSRKMRKQRAKQRIADGKRDVLRMLREHMTNSRRRWIPIMSIKAQLNGGGVSEGKVDRLRAKEKEWKRIVKEVDRDADVVRSCQMIDGVQKDCWKLSDHALSDHF